MIERVTPWIAAHTKGNSREIGTSLAKATAPRIVDTTQPETSSRRVTSQAPWVRTDEYTSSCWNVSGHTRQAVTTSSKVEPPASTKGSEFPDSSVQ